MSLQINDRMLFPGGKKKAFTLSYDDGITQDRRLIGILDRYRVKATFNLNSGLFGQEGVVAAGKKEVSHIKVAAEEARELYKDHEVAAHGQFHSCMTGMDSGRCVEEILQSRKALEELTGHPVTGYVYAFGAYDDTVLSAMKACGITYARTITSTHKFDIPDDFLTWDPTCHHDDEKIFDLADEFLSDGFYFNMLTPAKLFYVWGHSYEFDQCDNWDHMEELVRKVSGRDDVWYATNGEIRAYVEAYRRLVFSADSRTVYNPSAVGVCLGGMFAPDWIEVKPGQTAELIPPVDM